MPGVSQELGNEEWETLGLQGESGGRRSFASAAWGSGDVHPVTAVAGPGFVRASDTPELSLVSGAAQTDRGTPVPAGLSLLPRVTDAWGVNRHLHAPNRSPRPPACCVCAENLFGP